MTWTNIMLLLCHQQFLLSDKAIFLDICGTALAFKQIPIWF